MFFRNFFLCRESDCKQGRLISWQEKRANVVEKMRYAGDQLGENEVSEKLKANRNISNKIFGEFVRQFRHTNSG